MGKTSQASCPGGVTTEGAQFRSEIQRLQQRCGACGCLEEVALLEGLVLVVAEGDYPNAMPNSVASPVDLQTRIFALRGLSVLLDSDLALLYGVSTKALLQAVRRNPDCFASDFMFQRSNQELDVLRSQTVTSKPADGRGGRRSLPFAFTGQGVAMLSSVLRSDTAVRVNAEIMRAFVRLRRAAVVSGEIVKLIEDLASRVDPHDLVIEQLVESIRALMESSADPPSRPIGFTADIN